MVKRNELIFGNPIRFYLSTCKKNLDFANSPFLPCILTKPEAVEYYYCLLS